jgi:hypothetical protein
VLSGLALSNQGAWRALGSSTLSRFVAGLMGFDICAQQSGATRHYELNSS